MTKLLEFIFGKTLKVQDPFWGEMLDADSYYECRKPFAPTGTIVEIGLAKTPAASKAKQIAFFRWLEDNYDLVVNTIGPALKKKARESLPNYQIEDFATEFQLEYLFIPSCEATVKEWEISFFEANKLQHSCALNMRELEVTNILIDG